MSEVDEFAEFLGLWCGRLRVQLQLITLGMFLGPQPKSHKQERLRKFLGGNSSSYLGLSFLRMHNGLCICFRLNSQASSFVLFWSMVIRVASMSSGDFISFLSGVLIFLWEC